jgi:hypothetical protein
MTYRDRQGNLLLSVLGSHGGRVVREPDTEPILDEEDDDPELCFLCGCPVDLEACAGSPVPACEYHAGSWEHKAAEREYYELEGTDL